MKIAVMAAMLLLLSACGVPTAVVMTTAAIDGVTYVGTGKSLSGHALSEATDQDCSILFGITRGQFCKDKVVADEPSRNDAGFRIPKEGPAAETAASAAPTDVPSAGPQAVLEPRFYDFDYETPPESAATAPKTGDSGQTQWTLVLGAFPDYFSAEALARRVKPERGLVTLVEAGGKVQYVVTTRPLNRDQGAGRELNIRDLNLDSVKLMPVCTGAPQQDDCIPLDPTSAVQQATLP